MKKVLKNKKAFTLTEMIVVIAIIGILAGVLIPTITGYIKRANQSAAYQEAEAVLNIYETWETEVEAKLTTKGFGDYYLEISDGEELGANVVYINETDNEFVFVHNNGIIVAINLENNSVHYDYESSDLTGFSVVDTTVTSA